MSKKHIESLRRFEFRANKNLLPFECKSEGENPAHAPIEKFLGVLFFFDLLQSGNGGGFEFKFFETPHFFKLHNDP